MILKDKCQIYYINIFNSASKYLKENNDIIKLINCGLFLSEGNIFKIPSNNVKKANIICKTNYSKNYNSENSMLKNTDSLFHKKLHNKFFANYKNTSVNNPLNNTNSIINSNKFNDIKINNIKYINNNNKPLKDEKIFKIYSYLDKQKNESIFFKEKKANKNYFKNISKNNSEVIRKKYYKKEKFPIEELINPRKYIEYNLKTEPYDKKFLKSYNAQMKLINDKEFIRKKILERTDKIIKYNNNLFKLDVKQTKEDIFGKDLNEIKKVILDDGKKDFKSKYYDINDSFKEKNKKKIVLENNILKNINKSTRYKLINFDEEMNDIVTSTKNTTKYLNDISEKNKNLINNIKNIYNKSIKLQ